MLRPKLTSQDNTTLEVSGGVSGPFNAKLTEEWQDWLVNVKRLYTPAGNRKKPYYEQVLQMVSNAVTSIYESMITHSFNVCRIARKLHSKFCIEGFLMSLASTLVSRKPTLLHDDNSN